MNTIYPSPLFLNLTRDAFANRRSHVITITSSWRKRLIAREIQEWATSLAHVNEVVQRKTKRFPLCMVLMPSLMSMHHFAIAHEYVMSFDISEGKIEIIYKFKGR